MRLSVTELDAFRRWRDDEDASLDELLAQLRKQTPPTRNMEAGSAWHKALEKWDWGADEVDEVSQGGFTFRIAGNIELNLPEVTEMKGELELETPSGVVTLVGVVDGFDASGVRDYKLSQQFEAERYTDSYQWRCYLLMFGAQRFVYEVFVCSDPRASDTITIRDYHQLPFYAYPAMRADVQREVREFAAFIAHHLPERVQQPVGAA